MIKKNTRFVFVAAGMGTVLFLTTAQAMANPVTVDFTETPNQCFDVLSFSILNEEVGKTPLFDADETITYTVAAATTGDCTIPVAGTDDYTVTATNTTGHTLYQVFVVQNTGTTFDNWDGTIGATPQRAKFLVQQWNNNAIITFNLMNVVPNVSPTFDHPGVPHGGASNFSIVGTTNPIPTVSQWGIALMALLVLSAATVVIRGRRPATT